MGLDARLIERIKQRRHGRRRRHPHHPIVLGPGGLGGVPPGGPKRLLSGGQGAIFLGDTPSSAGAPRPSSQSASAAVTWVSVQVWGG